jgi:serine protease Do
VKSGDVVVSFDGRPVREARDLPIIVAESPVDTDLNMDVIRGGQKMTLTVRLKQIAKGVDDQVDPKAAQPSDSEDDNSATPAPDDGGKPSAKADGPILGMTLAELDDAARKQFKIDPSVDGVLVTDVEPGSPAAEKGIVAGDIVVEISQEFVSNPDDVASKINSLKEEDRRNAQVMISNAKGDLRFVAIRLE